LIHFHFGPDGHHVQLVPPPPGPDGQRSKCGGAPLRGGFADDVWYVCPYPFAPPQRSNTLVIPPRYDALTHCFLSATLRPFFYGAKMVKSPPGPFFYEPPVGSPNAPPPFFFGLARRPYASRGITRLASLPFGHPWGLDCKVRFPSHSRLFFSGVEKLFFFIVSGI